MQIWTDVAIQTVQSISYSQTPTSEIPLPGQYFSAICSNFGSAVCNLYEMHIIALLPRHTVHQVAQTTVQTSLPDLPLTLCTLHIWFRQFTRLCKAVHPWDLVSGSTLQELAIAIASDAYDPFACI